MERALDETWSITDSRISRDLAKLLTILHDNPADASRLLKEVFGQRRSRAHVVGVTGAPLVGKSTLIDRLLGILSRDNKATVVLAIDPTSAQNGGALLGDRPRMRDHYLDPRVFIRSLATRGAGAGLTAALHEMIAAAGMVSDVVIVETAGAGQVDTEIGKLVETLIVVMAPLGDEISLMKAGQTEHAHLIAANIRQGFPGSERFLADAKAAFEADGGERWCRRVFSVDALENRGVEELVRDGIYAHREFLKK